MPVQLSGRLQDSSYWQKVRRLANALLGEVPWLTNWTIVMRPKTAADVAAMDDGSGDAESRWYTHFDYQRRQLTFGIPRGDESDEQDPEDLASFLVLNLLDSSVGRDDDGGSDDPLDPPHPPPTDRWR
jgi:hypothetical protein